MMSRAAIKPEYMDGPVVDYIGDADELRDAIIEAADIQAEDVSPIANHRSMAAVVNESVVHVDITGIDDPIRGDFYTWERIDGVSGEVDINVYCDGRPYTAHGHIFQTYIVEI